MSRRWIQATEAAHTEPAMPCRHSAEPRSKSHSSACTSSATQTTLRPPSNTHQSTENQQRLPGSGRQKPAWLESTACGTTARCTSDGVETRHERPAVRWNTRGSAGRWCSAVVQYVPCSSEAHVFSNSSTSRCCSRAVATSGCCSCSNHTHASSKRRKNSLRQFVPARLAGCRCQRV